MRQRTFSSTSKIAEDNGFEMFFRGRQKILYECDEKLAKFSEAGKTFCTTARLSKYFRFLLNSAMSFLSFSIYEC